MDRALDYNDIKMAKDILNKNNDAFEEFTERFSKNIFYECVRCTGDTDEACDLVNEILLKCYTGMETYDFRKSMLSTWVMRIARNYLRDYNRSKRNMPVMVNCKDEFLDMYANKYACSDMCWDFDHKPTGKSNSKIACLKRALLYISKRDQLILHYRSEGISYKEISELLGMTVNNAMTAFSRAMKKLKELFFEEMGKQKKKEGGAA